MENTLWIIVTGTLVIVIFAGFFIATVIVNQKRFIRIQNEKLRESIQLQQALRERPRHIIKAQEEERRRVARDLHDGISQMLSSIMYKLHAIKTHLSTQNGSITGEVAGLADTVTGDCEKTLDELKRIAHNLRPKMFDELGFHATVRTLLDDFSKRTGINVEYAPESGESDDRPPIPQEIGLGLFRILQEGLTNIEKHARATSVIVTSSADGLVCRMTLADDGRGIGPVRPTPTPGEGFKYRGLGLLSMKERAELLGGQCDIVPNNPSGTKIVVEIPVQKG
jgi:two-component system NarL family sensor kinase